jgi:hypothetical protein
MSNTAAVQFHKRMPGLYGTSIWRTTTGRLEYLHCNHGCTDVEVCIDGHTDRDGWYVRYVCEHDHFTDTLGEWFPTLRDAKAWMTDNPNRVG